MTRTRTILGLVAGAILVLDSAAHTLLGGPQMRDRLAGSGAPADLVTGAMIGWQFAGAAMLVFGLIVLWTFADALRGRAVSLRPSLLVGALFALFGLAVFMVIDHSPVFLVTFVLPGALLLAAAWGREAAVARR